MEGSFLISVPRALAFLYREGKVGHWVDIRTTSDAILALTASGESIRSPHIQYAGDFLVANFRRERQGGSWGSELWDTALAIRALNRIPPKGQDLVEQGFEWIFAKQQPDGSFDGEPWDSLFVCLAALETGRSERVRSTIEWLISLQSPNGVVISSHYSGLFCQVLGEALHLTLPSSLRHTLHEAGIRALQCLWEEYDPDSLWGEGTWTNGYVVQGMLALRHPQVLAKFDDILRWYAKRQAPNGAWDDTVRTAIALQALLQIGIAYELETCNQKPLRMLTQEFVVRSTEDQLFRAIGARTQKAPVVLAKKLIDKDESGNLTITLTREREVYLAIALSTLGVIWAIVLNWGFLRRFFFR